MAKRPPEKPRDLNTHHIFTPPPDREMWEWRKRDLRTQILFSAGIWPMPEKTPLNPQITGKIDGPDYTIENVAIETRPGFYLCGNLYRPKGKKGPFPAIANPHGHWSNGRLEMQADVPKADPNGKMGDGRGNLVAIGVNLARQGFVVFAYDMVGYNDTSQVDHKFAGNLRCWLWGVSLSGLQLWNSIRVLDYLESLPDVDRKRIGVTGASGGGTQTFLLSAVDDRVKCAVPVNMISAYMQGGCLCENGPGLRVRTDNVEIGAMFAPKPLLLIAATGDWTSKNPSEEWPSIKKVYDLYAAGDRTAVKQFNYGHNYNIESREAMYAWFGRWLLNDSDTEHFREKPFEADVKAMRVWNDQHPMPTNALKEPALIQSMIDSSEKQLASLWPKDAKGLRRFKETMRPALAASVDAYGGWIRVELVADPNPLTLIIADYDDRDKAERLSQAVGMNCSVKILRDSAPAADLWRDFFSCYNRIPLGESVQEAVMEIRKRQGSWPRSRLVGTTVWDMAEVPSFSTGPHHRVRIIGIGKAGLAVLVARGLIGEPAPAIIDAAETKTAVDDVFAQDLYAPGFRRCGDFCTAAVLGAPMPLCLFNTGSEFRTDRIQAAYKGLHASLKVVQGDMTDSEIAGWLAGK